jgi:hypothetical protein
MMEMNIQALSDKDYRAYERESFSSLKYILKSPKDFLYYKEKPFSGSTASLLGTCIHHYLQGNRHLVAFSPYPKLKKHIEATEEFERNFRSTIDIGEEGVIVPKSFEPKLNAIAKNFNEHRLASKLLSTCEFEKAYLFEINGLPLKGKVDGVGPNGVVEIKSSSQATTFEEFKAEAEERDYDLQAAMYCMATGCGTHYFIVVNTQEPFKVQVYKSSP